MDSQYGNGGYQQMGYGANPYDQRDNNGAAQGGDRYNNYAQGRYDDRMSAYFYTSCAIGS